MCADPLWLQENTRCCPSTPLTAALASDLCVPLQWLSGEVTGLEGKALLLVPALPSRVALDGPVKSMSLRPLPFVVPCLSGVLLSDGDQS